MSPLIDVIYVSVLRLATQGRCPFRTCSLSPALDTDTRFESRGFDMCASAQAYECQLGRCVRQNFIILLPTFQLPWPWANMRARRDTSPPEESHPAQQDVPASSTKKFSPPLSRISAGLLGICWRTAQHSATSAVSSTPERCTSQPAVLRPQRRARNSWTAFCKAAAVRRKTSACRHHRPLPASQGGNKMRSRTGGSRYAQGRKCQTRNFSKAEPWSAASPSREAGLQRCPPESRKPFRIPQDPGSPHISEPLQPPFGGL